MEENKIGSKKIFNLALITIIAYFLINYFDIIKGFLDNVIGIISPFVVGACLAFLINIPMGFLEKKFMDAKTRKGKKRFRTNTLPRILALVLSLIFIFMIIFLVMKLIIPELINVFKLLIDKVPYYVSEINLYIENNPENLSMLKDAISKINLNEESIKNEIINIASGLLSSSISLVGGVIGVIANFIISLVFAFYILTSKEKLKEQFTRLFKAYLSPKKFETVRNVLRITKTTFSNFFTVQCLEATILGILCSLGMLVFDIPYAISIGVLVGVTALVPVIGAFAGVIIGSILILSVAPAKVIPFVIFVLILQQIEANFIYPKVVGESVGLPGIWVLMAVSIGGSLFGIIGMLIGVPAVSVVYILLKRDVKKRLKEEKA